MGSRNCCRSCGKNDCDCRCGGHHHHNEGNKVRIGAETADFGRFQTADGEDVKIGEATTQVDVCGDTSVLLTLPDCPRFGRAPLVINNTGNALVTIESLDADIVGQNVAGNIFLGPRSSAILTFTGCGTGQCGEWAVLFGQSAAA